MSRFKVWLHSKVSPAWSYYEGAIEVGADGADEAKDRACRQLHRTIFPDRPASSWVVDRVEPVRERRGAWN